MDAIKVAENHIQLITGRSLITIAIRADAA
jgi:hypothetical protein